MLSLQGLLVSGRPQAAVMNEDSKRAHISVQKNSSVSRSDSSPLSVLDFLNSPASSTPAASPSTLTPSGSVSPVLPQSPLVASQRLFARLSSSNFKTPGRDASSNGPQTVLGVRPPSPRRQRGARARLKARSFGRSSSLTDNKVLRLRTPAAGKPPGTSSNLRVKFGLCRSFWRHNCGAHPALRAQSFSGLTSILISYP